MAEIAKRHTGAPVSRATRVKNAETATWDTRVYNRLTQEWEREGKRLTYRQAYSRYTYRARTNPYAEYDIYLVPGRRPKVETSPNGSQSVDA